MLLACAKAMMGFVKDVLQYIYVFFLRLFEDLFAGPTIGAFHPEKRVWRNFSGDVEWSLSATNYFEPDSLEQIVEIVRKAKNKGVGVRVVGSGHSFNDINEPALDSYVINLSKKFNKVLEIIPLEKPEKDGIEGSMPVVAHGVVQGGIQLRNLTYQLAKKGYGVHNMGNYYQQTVAGVISTGTHGTTGKFKPDTFTSIVVRLQIVNGLGKVEYLEGGIDSITLGALGIVTEATLRLVPMYWLDHETHPVKDIIKACDYTNIENLLSAHDYMFFRWSTVVGSRSCIYNRAKMETFNVTTKDKITPLKNIFNQIRLIGTYYFLTDWFNGRKEWLKRIILLSGTLFPNRNIDEYFLAYAVPGVVTRHLESEWALPRKNTQAAIKWISEHIDCFGDSAFEIHVRFIPPDGANLAPGHGRETVYIDINIPVKYGFSLEPFYRAMQALDGRPHWSKMHDLRAAEIRPMYDMARFDKLREGHDPENIFGRAPYITKVLGPHPSAKAKTAANGHAAS